MKNVLVIGEILVEIMADTTGDGFHCPQALTGPFPSGAPAIFIDQVAKFNQNATIISAVGDDDFGRLNIERLSRDGVDVSGVSIDKTRPTGSAFVRYDHDGSRNFVFNIQHSACGNLKHTPQTSDLIQRANHLHVTGSSLSTDEFIRLNLEAAQKIKANDGTVSFDPNIRKQVLVSSKAQEIMHKILALTDLYLPSGDELCLLTKAQDDSSAIYELLDLGVKAIVHKNGAQGAVYYDNKSTLKSPKFCIEEVDPTGAGDCFAGAFVSQWLLDGSPMEALTQAAAAGALAVMSRGPMEGVSDRTTVNTFIQAHKPAA